METAKTGTNDNLRLSEQLCFPLYACAKEVVRQYRKPLEKLNLTYTQYLVMMVLWEQGSMTEGQLGRIIHLDSGTLAPLLKRLERNGLIRRTRPEDNERRLLLSLTKKGDGLRKDAQSVPNAMEGCIKLPKEELIQLRTLLIKAINAMEE